MLALSLLSDEKGPHKIWKNFDKKADGGCYWFRCFVTFNINKKMELKNK